MDDGEPPKPAVVRYMPKMVSTIELEELLDHAGIVDPALWSSDLPDLLCLLSLAMPIYALSPINRPNLFQVGYFVVSEDSFSSFWDNVGREIVGDLKRRFGVFAERFPSTGRELLRRLLSFSGEPWPIKAGPVAFWTGPGKVGLDIKAAGIRLTSSLQFPSTGGAIANVRSASFEEAMQRAIDATSWKPQVDARAFRERRTLRLRGNAIGDVDAIASGRHVSLLVSCKSILYTAAYDAGDFSAVKTALQKIQAAMIELDRFVETLRMNPVGDNYNVTSMNTLIGVVVTPHILFVPSSLLDRQAGPGLRYYSSAPELVDWLSRTSTEIDATQMVEIFHRSSIAASSSP
jgi:hypothetical protein